MKAVNSFFWAIALAFAIPLFSGCMTLNPATGKEEFIIFTTPTEVMLGAETHAQLSTSLHFSNDKAAQARLEMIGQRVAQVSDRQDFQYHFFLVDKDEMNAFTVPGGYIYFYTGLYKKLRSDDEISAVLAHEIGHCSARHVVKKFQMALGYDFIGSMVFGQAQNEFAVRLAKMGADSLMNVAMASYSREDEYEADRLGVKYMYLAGYDPQGMVRTFEVLGQGSKGDDNDWLLLQSHPKLSDRIEAVKKEIADVKNKY
jgi:predicted Zn-dependent protease